MPEGFKPGLFVLSGPPGCLKLQVALNAADSQCRPTLVVAARYSGLPSLCADEYPEALVTTAGCPEELVYAAVVGAEKGAAVIVDGLPSATCAWSARPDGENLDRTPAELSRDRRLVMYLLDKLSSHGAARGVLHFVLNERRRSPERLKLEYADDIILGIPEVHTALTRTPGYSSKYMELTERHATWHITRANGTRRETRTTLIAPDGVLWPDMDRLVLGENRGVIHRSGAYVVIDSERYGPGRLNAIVQLEDAGRIHQLRAIEEAIWERDLKSESRHTTSQSKRSTPAGPNAPRSSRTSPEVLQERLSSLSLSPSTTRSRRRRS